MRDDRERWRDILEAIEHIEKYAAKGRTAFQADELIQTWFLRHLQIIGEASRALSESVKNSYCRVRKFAHHAGSLNYVSYYNAQICAPYCQCK